MNWLTTTSQWHPFNSLRYPKKNIHRRFRESLRERFFQKPSDKQGKAEITQKITKNTIRKFNLCRTTLVKDLLFSIYLALPMSRPFIWIFGEAPQAYGLGHWPTTRLNIGKATSNLCPAASPVLRSATIWMLRLVWHLKYFKRILPGYRYKTDCYEVSLMTLGSSAYFAQGKIRLYLHTATPPARP